MAIVPIVLLALLALIVSFGVGFILNMLTKYWMSSGIAFAVLFMYIMWKVEFRLQLVDWILLLLVAFGALSSAFAIRTLKRRGFRMFQ